MKYKICYTALVVCMIVGCNNKKNSEDAGNIAGTDSSLMVKNGIDANTTGDVVTDSTKNINLVKDSSKIKTATGKINTDSVAKVTGKTDAVKKAKKGRISLEQNTPVHTGNLTADKEGFYANTEVLPSFNGGEKALENFFEKNIQYPQEATDNNAEGTVLLNFAVDEKGKIYAPKVMNKNIGYGIEKEALRVFDKMPVWMPGKIKGKNVKTRYTLPIKFQLEN